MENFMAVIIALFLGGAAGYLGTLMLSQRMALVAGPLGHLTLPGIALALIFHFDVSLGAFPFVILGVFFIWFFEMNTKLPMEALTAVVFATGVAITFLFLPEEKTVPALIGDISQINFPATLGSVILSGGVFLVTKRIYPEMALAGISEDLAKAQRINVKRNHFLYLLCIALIVALGVRIVGGLLTAALMAIPACTARNLSVNLVQYSYRGFFFGSLSCILGMVVFQFTNLPIGPLIVIASAILFLISLFFRR